MMNTRFVPSTKGKKRKFRPLSLAALFFIFAISTTSCWHAPFNAELSASEYTVSKLGSPVWAVLLKLPSEVSGAYYVPFRDPSEYNYGALVWRSTGQIRFAYLNSMGNYSNYSNLGVMVPNEMAYAAQIRMPMGSNSTNKYLYFGASGSGGLEQLLMMTGINTAWYPGVPVVGMGIVPDTAVTTNDWFYMAYFSGGLLYYVSSQINSASTFPPTATPIQFTNTIPVPAAPGFFGQAPGASGFYLSAKMSDGKYRTHYWVSTAAFPTTLPLSVQITGILSDGRLLSDSGSSLSVYSGGGSFQFSINTGALHFVHERYDSINSCWVSVFTRVVEIPNQHDDNDFLVQIFEIKTADLKSLAN